MKLDRTTNGTGRGKYGLILARKLAEAERIHGPQTLMEIEHAIKVLETARIIDWGDTVETEFFVMRLRDKYAAAGLNAYATAAHFDDPEYAGDINAMVLRSGPRHPNCKVPD